jgi:uncharacterized membrane protein
VIASLLFLALADPGTDALAVFQAKCASCHSPQAKKVEGKFNYILDLPRLATDKEKLENIGLLVASGNMPPPTVGQLTLEQKETVLAWIKAGAPKANPSSLLPEDPKTVGPTVLPEQPAPVAEVSVPSAEAPGPALHFFEWLGKFHLLLLHFPIALVFVAALFESWYWYNQRNDWNEATPDAVRFCLLLAAAFAVPVAVLGWLYAMGGHGASQPGTLLLHRWAGTLGALLLILTAVLSEGDIPRRERRWPTRAMIYVSALTIGVTGHFGGMLVHGADFLDW